MVQISLRRFKVQAFRSCKKVEFSPHPELSCLVGTNGAGKTNILQSILLLKKSQRVRYSGRDDRDTALHRCTVSAEFSVGKQSVRTQTVLVTSRLLLGATERSGEEVLEREQKWQFKGFNWSEDPIDLDNSMLLLDNVYGPRSSQSRIIIRNRQEAVRLHKSLQLDEPPRPVIAAFRAVRSFISAINYYSASQFTNPALCPSLFEVDEDGDLRESYSPSVNREHTRLLHSLYSTAINNPTGWEDLIGLIGKNGLGIVDDITWKERRFETTAYEVQSGANIVNKNVKRRIIIPIVLIGKSRLSFNQLSEGTFRVIALIHLLLSDDSKLILLEEPEVSIHHGLLNSIIEITKGISSSRQVILTTHSDNVVDRFIPENMYLVRRDSSTGTKLSPLAKSLSNKDFAGLKSYLKDEGSLGEFWKRRSFEG